MAAKFQLLIRPTAGSNVNAVATDPKLAKALNSFGTELQTFDCGGYNFDTTRHDGEVCKSPGNTKWYSSAPSPPAGGSAADIGQQAFLLLDDGTNSEVVGIYGGEFYAYSADGTPTKVDAASAFNWQATLPISIIQYGGYAIISSVDYTPYKWKHGDANLTTLIQSGTGYKFKFMIEFQGHLVGAYSDQTNGNIEIRWTEALPSFASLDFPAANQLFKPDMDIGITGIKTLGDMQCLVYGKRTVHSLVYNPDSSIIFSLVPISSNVGTCSPWSIIDTGKSHAFYDKNRGFVELSGGSAWQVLSDDILTWIQDITQGQEELIIGGLYPQTNELCWAIPVESSLTPNVLVYYNMATKQWRRELRSVSAMMFTNFNTFNPLTWTQFIALSPQTPAWPTSGKWSDFIAGITGNLLFGDKTGYTYWVSGSDNAGGDWAAYRIEPVMSLPDPTRPKRVQEMHFGFTKSGDFSVDVYWRTGETNQDVLESEWTWVGSVSAEPGASNILYPDMTANYHQFKWGTDLKNEDFGVSTITLKGIRL